MRARWATGVVAAAGLLGMVQAPPQGPVAWWPLEETAAPSLNQTGAFGNGAWLNGATSSNVVPPLNTFPDAGSMSFDGDNDCVEFANAAPLENVQEGSYTLSAWFNPTDVPAAGTNEGRYAILYKAGWHLGIAYNRNGNGNGNFVFEHWLTGDAWEGVSGGTEHAPGSWYHVAGVVDLAAGTSQLYVDGTSEGTNTWTPNTATREYGTNPWRIGCANPAAAVGSYRWAAKGLIDDPRIYGRALSAEEVGILASGVPRVQGPVVATGGVQEVTVTWSAPGAPPGYAYSYNLARSVDGGPFVPLASGVTGTSYTDTTATTFAGTNFVYQVTAVSVAESGPVMSSSGTPTLPPPRTQDHDEGLLDGNCACGSSIGAGPAALLALLAAGALLIAVRR